MLLHQNRSVIDWNNPWMCHLNIACTRDPTEPCVLFQSSHTACCSALFIPAALLSIFFSREHCFKSFTVFLVIYSPGFTQNCSLIFDIWDTLRCRRHFLVFVCLSTSLLVWGGLVQRMILIQASCCQVTRVFLPCEAGRLSSYYRSEALVNFVRT